MPVAVSGGLIDADTDEQEGFRELAVVSEISGRCDVAVAKRDPVVAPSRGQYEIEIADGFDLLVIADEDEQGEDKQRVEDRCATDGGEDPASSTLVGTGSSPV